MLGISTVSRGGSVGLSSRHCLAHINLGLVSSKDLVEFAQYIQARVQATFGVALVPEPSFVG